MRLVEIEQTHQRIPRQLVLTSCTPSEPVGVSIGSQAWRQIGNYLYVRGLITARHAHGSAAEEA